MSRALSPAFVAEYQTRLPDKKLPRAKLHEFYTLAKSQAAPPVPATGGSKTPNRGRKQ